jgi:hypothetical protein
LILRSWRWSLSQLPHLQFPDITADGSITLGAAVTLATLLVKSVSPALATLAGFAAGCWYDHRRVAHEVQDQWPTQRHPRDDRRYSINLHDGQE